MTRDEAAKLIEGNEHFTVLRRLLKAVSADGQWRRMDTGDLVRLPHAERYLLARLIEAHVDPVQDLPAGHVFPVTPCEAQITAEALVAFGVDPALVEPETDVEFTAYIVSRWRDGVMAKAECIGICTRGQLPDGKWIGAWTWDGKSVGVDLDKARALLVDYVRHERNNLLTESDGDKARLDDIGTPEQRSAIAKHRQELRDLPAKVQADIAALELAALEAYKPAFPTKPI